MAKIPTKDQLGGIPLPASRPMGAQVRDFVSPQLQGLGQALGGLGAVMADANHEAEDYAVQQGLDAFKAQQKERAKEAIRMAQPGATGLTDSFAIGYKADAKTFFATVPERLKPRVDRELFNTETSLAGVTNDFEVGERTRFEGVKLDESVNRNLNEAANAPSDAKVQDASLASARKAIEDNPYLTPIQKSERLAKLPNEAARTIGTSVNATKDANAKVFSGAGSSDIPAVGANLLNAIASTESPTYNTLNGGEKFSSYADHPRRKGAGGESTAAGRYQFVQGTWDRAVKALGLKDFSPASQDRAAWWLAQQDYKARTGRELASDLQAGEYEKVRRNLSDTWRGLHDSAGKFMKNVGAGSGATPAADTPVSGEHDFQTSRQYFQQRFPDADPDTLNSLASSAVSARNSFIAQDQIKARAEIDGAVTNAPAAMETTGTYSGKVPTETDFIAAYGLKDGQEKAAAFDASMQVAGQSYEFRTMSATDIEAAVAAALPTSSGDTAALDQKKYAVLSQAADSAIKARQADPSTYTTNSFPNVKAAWAAATPGSQSFTDALALTDQAQAKLGIAPQDRALLPTEAAKNVVTTFKAADLPQAQRIGAVASTILATNDPAQQSAIFRQLVDAGLPDMTEGAVRAYARGDQAAGERLFQAALINPKDLPGKIASSEKDINEAIQSEVMADGQVGDLFYGLSFGQSENLVTAERDGKLLTRAVQLRMASGDDLDAAVAGARKDLFGAVQVVDNSNAQALIPETADANGFTAGTEALLPQVEQALHSAYPEPDAKVTGTARALVNASRENRIKDVVAQGAFRNAAGGFAFVDPFTGKAVAGADGKPLSFTIEQILDAGKASPTRKTGDPLADANNPNSKFNQSLTAAPPEATPPSPSPEPVRAEQRSNATSGVPVTAAPLSLQEQLSDAQRSAVSAAVRAISAGADPKAITNRLRKAGVPKELWPE